MMGGALAGAVTDIGNVRFWTAPDHTRFVFDVSQPVQHKLFRLQNPHRLVIDFEKVALKQQIEAGKFKNKLVSGLRYAKQDNHGLRVVLDLNKSIRPKSFLLKPNDHYGHRLVIDIYEELEELYPIFLYLPDKLCMT